MITVHLQEYEGPRQSYCGLRLHVIRSQKGEMLRYIKDVTRIQRLKRGHRWCEACSNHPALQLKILAEVEL